MKTTAFLFFCSAHIAHMRRKASQEPWIQEMLNGPSRHRPDVVLIFFWVVVQRLLGLLKKSMSITGA